MSDDSEPETETPPAVPAESGVRGLIDDIETLVENGKTYAEAELAFQKTRLAFIAENAKGAAIMGGIAAVLVVLAIVALVFGSILALTPMVGPWAATGIAFGTLLVVALILAQMARGRIRKVLSSFEPDDDEQA